MPQVEPLTVVDTFFLSSAGREGMHSKHRFSRYVPLQILEGSMCWAEVTYKGEQKIIWFDAMLKARPKYFHKTAQSLLQDANFVNSKHSWAPRGQFPMPSPHNCRVEIKRSQWCVLKTDKTVIVGNWWSEQIDLASRTFSGEYFLYMGMSGNLRVAFDRYEEGANAVISFG